MSSSRRGTCAGGGPAVKSPDGPKQRTQSPCDNWSWIQFDIKPPGTRLTVMARPPSQGAVASE